MTVGGPEGGRETQTATELGTQESGAESYMGKCGPAGATPGKPPPWTPTRRKCGYAMG